MAKIGPLDVSRLCLGANTFGWTAGRDDSFAVLDAFTGAGGTFVDTADVYVPRPPAQSGDSERKLELAADETAALSAASA